MSAPTRKKVRELQPSQAGSFNGAYTDCALIVANDIWLSGGGEGHDIRDTHRR
jgi:hypothetical protein